MNKSLADRVAELKVDAKDIYKIEATSGDVNLEIPNIPGKQNSVKIYVHIAGNDQKIEKKDAQQGLEIYGQELVDEATNERSKHPAIDLLEDIVSGKLKSVSIKISKVLTAKTLPFNKTEIVKIIDKYPTPFHIYNEKGIVKSAHTMYESFGKLTGFKNFYAVKALPNPAILKIIKGLNMGVDCSSMAELVLSERAGFKGEDIMFTSNDTAAKEFVKAVELGAIINLDDITHIEFLEQAVGKLPDLICFRFNPGPERTGNVIIGNPAEAKYGLTRDQLFEAYKICLDKGVKRFGLHTMVASNELDPQYFVETARALFELAVQIKQRLGIKLEFTNLGGGLGIPYRPDQKKLDVSMIVDEMSKLYESMLKPEGLSPKIFLECGRYITGPNGYLVAKAIHTKSIYREYIGLDASMANLMRPSLYGAYHHITVMGKEAEPLDHVYDVTGSLCENNDKLAIQRSLPKVDIGDIIVIHDTGAHGHAMGFNYNGKLRSAELLMDPSGEVELIRRAETLDDLFATLNF